MSRALPVLLAATIACLLAGCSSGGPGSEPSATAPAPATSATSPPASLGFSGRYAEAPALLAACGLRHRTIKPQVGQPWYHNGTVLPLSGPGSDDHDAEFSTWWDANSTISIGGMTLLDWREWATARDKLPSAVCGPSVSASALQAQVYPGLPDPWHS